MPRANLDGKVYGAWKFFRRDGSIIRGGSFERGTELGVWRTHDRTGVTQETDFSKKRSRA